ncbi:MAG: LysM peptidoglycan-binding domain-containing protein [Phascolarctobacterium sp.]|nr:LysM peptidoglycan-binding domain-containing protein [Candidatus Phascolarctobacterium caballi]
MALNGNTNEEKIWNFLKSKGLNSFAVAGLMGNLFAESGLNPKNLQNSYEKKLGHTDETYTAAVDSGKYKNFKSDAAGYGLAQWTYGTRKAALLEYAKSGGKSVGDLEMQLGFLMKELTGNYAGVLAEIKKATSVLQASNTVLMKFERPADQSEAVQKKRAAYGQTYYDKYAAAKNNTQNGGTSNMNVSEVRKKFAAIATKYKGVKEGSAQHHAIIDKYNAHKPLARGYKVTYTDAWCATFASMVAIEAGYTDIIPTECGCNAQIALWQKMGRWCENDAKVPEPGDYIYYDWDDNGNGDCTGGSEHVGIVTAVNGNTITVTEGNKSNAVGDRTLQVNGRYIRGYGVPDFSKKATADKPKQEEQKPDDNTEFALGEVVMFNGNTHYTSANATDGKSCKPGKAKVTQKYNGKHPYHVVREGGDGGSVCGWVNASDLSHINSAAERTYTVKSGDSLWAIAAKQLGDGSRYNEIKTMNGLSSNTIYAGQVLKLPTK